MNTTYQNGLSPLARGTRGRLKKIRELERFIPAGAGNTRRGRGVTQPLPVYPRWRGEHSATWPTGTTRSGLSPLARGTQMTKSEIFTKARFIPAGAGNTNGHSKSNGSGTVYPRWRGEHESGGYIVI